MKDKKLVTVLVLIIVLLLIGGAYLLGVRSSNNYEVYRGEYPNLDNSQVPKDYSDKTTESDSWITDLKIGLVYNSKWQVTPQLYKSPAQEQRGETDSVSGYMFAIPSDSVSGSFIIWGGPQSACSLDEINFKYGVSTLACLKGIRASIGRAGAREVLSQQEINSFGDFVLKNQ